MNEVDNVPAEPVFFNDVHHLALDLSPGSVNNLSNYMVFRSRREQGCRNCAHACCHHV